MAYRRNEDHVSGTPGTWEPDAKKKRKRYVKRVIDAVLTTVILLVINVIALYVLLQELSIFSISDFGMFVR